MYGHPAAVPDHRDGEQGGNTDPATQLRVQHGDDQGFQRACSQAEPEKHPEAENQRDQIQIPVHALVAEVILVPGLIAGAKKDWVGAEINAFIVLLGEAVPACGETRQWLVLACGALLRIESRDRVLWD